MSFRTIADMVDKTLRGENPVQKMSMPSINSMINPLPVFGYSQMSQTPMKQTRVPLINTVVDKAQQVMEMVKKAQQNQ
jgi:hypothetical protein